MRTARSSSRPRGSPPGTPGSRPLRDQVPPGPGASWDQAHPPGADPPGPDTPPPVDRITDACENITLPQLRCGR